ncbi:MAG: hypothetical protein IJT73_05145 [Selenomonadaceae bacterium]|nr:hypothetical protein [Selenomonadaceae bacterium]
MKMNNRTFNYPVLASGRDDYKNCAFEADYNFRQTAAAIIFNFDFDTDCPEIKNLIARGEAEYVVHFESAATIFRKILKSARAEISTEISLSRVKSVLEIVAAIVLKNDVENFYCKDWSEDFSGLKFNLTKGNVLAYKTLPSLKIPDNPDNFAGNESIFTVCRAVLEETNFEVDFEGEKIKITLGGAEYDFFVGANENLELQPVVNSLVILPALIYVLEELQAEGAVEDYQYKDWFLSLKHNYGADFVDDLKNKDLFELAQELINLPMARAFESLQKIYGEDEE